MCHPTTTSLWKHPQCHPTTTSLCKHPQCHLTLHLYGNTHSVTQPLHLYGNTHSVTQPLQLYGNTHSVTQPQHLYANTSVTQLLHLYGNTHSVNRPLELYPTTQGHPNTKSFPNHPHCHQNSLHLHPITQWVSPNRIPGFAASDFTQRPTVLRNYPRPYPTGNTVSHSVTTFIHSNGHRSHKMLTLTWSGAAERYDPVT